MSRILAIYCCFALSACGTVVPKPVQAHQASWDVNVTNNVAVQNSGIVGSDANGYHVTPNYYLRFLDMEAKYGSFLSPARMPGDVTGITPEPFGSAFFQQGARWIFSIPARDDFHVMNAKRKSEEAP